MTYVPQALARELFSQSEATLANGASIATDWIDMNDVSKYQISYIGDAALSLTIDSRAASSGSADLSTPATYSGTFYLADLPVRQRYMKFTLTNSTGSDVDNVNLAVKGIYGGVEGASVFPIDINPSQFSPAALTQSVLIGKDTAGNYQNMEINQAGALVTENFSTEVARGTQAGYTLWNKFGYNLDIDAAASETVWSVGGTFSPMTSADTLTIYSSDANDNNGGTGVNSVVIYGIDENRAAQIEVVTLNGGTSKGAGVTTTNQWLGVNRVAIFLAGSGQTNAGTITVDTTTGVNVQAEMPSGEGVTQQCVFHVPADTNFVAEWLWINCLKLSGGGGSPRVTVTMQVYSAVNNAVQEVFRVDIDTSLTNLVDVSPNLPFPIGEKSAVWIQASTNTNNTAINARFSGILIDDA